MTKNCFVDRYVDEDVVSDCNTYVARFYKDEIHEEFWLNLPCRKYIDLKNNLSLMRWKWRKKFLDICYCYKDVSKSRNQTGSIYSAEEKEIVDSLTYAIATKVSQYIERIGSLLFSRREGNGRVIR